MKTKQTIQYAIISKDEPLAVHSIGYHGESGKKRAQARIDNGECAKFWSDKEQAVKGFRVVDQSATGYGA